MLGRRTNHFVQIGFTQSKNNSAHISPVDRARTHRAWFRACVKSTSGQLFSREVLTRKPHQIRLGVTGAITARHYAILCCQQHVVVFIHQDRAKGMIAVISCSLGTSMAVRKC
jgi:hypothetical protein